MEKKETPKVKSNVISGMSSTIGATVGVVAGSVISSEVNAAEMPEENQEVEIVSAHPSHGSSHAHQNTPVPEPDPGEQEPSEPVPEPDPNNQEPGEPFPNEPVPEPNPNDQEPSEPLPDEPNPDVPDVRIDSYNTIPTANGNQDVAVVNIDGQPVTIVDVNQDGIADTLASDLNNNGQIEDNEIIDVSDQNIAMQPLQEAVNTGIENFYAQTDDIDYINDANVDDYMA